MRCIRDGWLFIILFLHQTTTSFFIINVSFSCLSSCSYIKPQLPLVSSSPAIVLFIILFLHQTTTTFLIILNMSMLFIILFLHQTTTLSLFFKVVRRCLSSCSYIKPQPVVGSGDTMDSCLSSCSYIKPQLSLMVLAIKPCCLSSCSYIKPQHVKQHGYIMGSCLSSCSYIKPQLGLLAQ